MRFFDFSLETDVKLFYTEKECIKKKNHPKAILTPHHGGCTKGGILLDEREPDCSY
jgi:hypothetical protein